MQVTVYTQVNCQPCRLTGMKLKQLSIEFSAVRLDQDAAAVDAVKALGYAAAPVVVVDFGDGASWSWQGYRPSEIEKLEKVLDGADPEVVFAA